MESRFAIQALWEDDDMLTIESHATSWGFVDKTQVYTTYDALMSWAEQLAALPIEPGQSVNFQAGQRKSYGYLGVTISVLDAVGL